MLGGCFHVWLGRRRGLGAHVNTRPTSAEERKKRKSGVYHCCSDFARCYSSCNKSSCNNSRVCDALRLHTGIAHHPISRAPCLLPLSLTPPPCHGRLACIRVR